MLSKLITLVAIVQSVFAETLVLKPPAVQTSNKDIAVVWVGGALCAQEAYRKIATEFQNQASVAGYNAWVAVPHFLEDTPNPPQMGGAMDASFKDLKANGFNGGDKFMFAHSLGTAFG